MPALDRRAARWELRWGWSAWSWGGVQDGRCFIVTGRAQPLSMHLVPHIAHCKQAVRGGRLSVTRNIILGTQ